MELNNVLTVTEYASKYKKDPGNIRRMLASGRLQGEKIGNQWVIPINAEYPIDKRQKTGQYKNWRKRVAFNSNIELKTELKLLISDLNDIYKDKLKAIILYGSYSRGEQTVESDVDIAIILSKPATKYEKHKMYACVSEHELSCGKVLSVVDIDSNEMINWGNVVPFYKNIEKDGIVLWKAQ